MIGFALFKRLSALLLFVAIAPMVCADQVYVDNVGGDDRNDGTRNGGPVKTIQQAIRIAKPGDEIVLKKNDQPYREEVSFSGVNRDGVAVNRLRFIGNGAVLEGADPINGIAWEAVRGDVYRVLPVALSHQMLYVDGKPGKKGSIDSNGKRVLEPLQWVQQEGWIYFRTDRGKSPYHYDLACCSRQVGITLYRVRDITVEDLVVQGFQYDGVNAFDLVSESILVGVTLRGNGRSGVSIGGASHLVVESCLIGDNGRAQIRTEGSSRSIINHSDIVESDSAKNIDRQGGQVVRDNAKVN